MVCGDGRGHEIGFPTANILTSSLPDATFSCRVTYNNRIYLGAGTYSSNKLYPSKNLDEVSDDSQKDSLQRHKGVFEVHILDFDEDIYGKILHIELLDNIRKNQRFDNLHDLQEAIEHDISHVRAHWSRMLTL